VKTNIFSSMNHSPKTLRFLVMPSFFPTLVHPLTAIQEALMRACYASLRFARNKIETILMLVSKLRIFLSIWHHSVINIGKGRKTRVIRMLEAWCRSLLPELMLNLGNQHSTLSKKNCITLCFIMAKILVMLHKTTYDRLQAKVV